MNENMKTAYEFIKNFINFNIEHAIYYFKDFNKKFLNTQTKLENETLNSSPISLQHNVNE